MKHAESETHHPQNAGGGGLSMFAGVFTPSILTILGLILFLRLGFVVGGLGLLSALGVIVLAHLISILTSISLAAVTTNLRIKGGGIYYLIARTLGVEHGGTIGLVMFVAQSVSIGFYCVGFAEVVSGLMGVDDHRISQLIAGAAIAGLFLLAWLGANWATKFQYVVMFLLVAGLVSFAVGSIERWDQGVLLGNLHTPEQAIPFWVAFAVFFPAVTGFTQGVNMSGDLCDPSRSIPLGTFLAVGIALVIYLLAPILLAAAHTGPQLGANDAFRSSSAIPLLVDIGAIAATLSSALASFLGAPRILQSLAKDRVFKVLQPFSRGVGSASNPRRAVLLSAVIALVTVALGDLNMIAGVVSMFFLISYGLINYATYYEARSASPSFRPTYAFYDQRISLAAAIGCLATMIVIDVTAGLLAVAIMAAIYQFIRFRGAPARWADGRRSYHLQQVRDHLFEARAESEHPRDWRPMLLVVSDNSDEQRDRLLHFATWLEGGAGIATVVQVIEAQEHELGEKREQVLESLQQAIVDAESDAFPLVVAAPHLEEALLTVIQSVGVGPLKVNTLLASWLRLAPAEGGFLTGSRYANMLRVVAGRGCNLVVLDADDDDWNLLTATAPEKRVIDVWWGSEETGQLPLLLAYLMQRTGDWDEAHLRLLTVCEPADVAMRTVELTTLLNDSRVDAELIVEAASGLEPEAIVAQSAGSSVVFLPATIRGGRFYHPFGGEIADILDQLPIVVIATTVQDIDLDADPDANPDQTADEISNDESGVEPTLEQPENPPSTCRS